MGRFNNESGRSGRTGRRQSYQRKKYSSYESREKEYKFKPHGYGKDKQNISYGKIVEKITTKIKLLTSVVRTSPGQSKIKRNSTSTQLNQNFRIQTIQEKN